ncbi:hypothetical protein DRE_00425 [Drechslerella stenobrocha 248]|uniref:RNase III domain-containing protein n=1 Tax=Drechslerella stenobrocha 248 TaxID=1043628 RepID=W7I4V7_9PEZI|nr:hypothetical protein DRE_00425 [Drechslerella stenobrocha 248]
MQHVQQQVQQQPAPTLTAPPPGFRMNTITRPFVPVATHMRVPFQVNDSVDVLNEMYIKLLGPGGDGVLTEQVKWQCVTHKSFDHGLQPYNTKLVFYGRRVAYLHASLYMVHRRYTPINPQSGQGDGPPLTIEALSNDPSLLLHSIKKGNPVNRVNYFAINNLIDSTNMFGIAKTCGLVGCLRWKPRNPANLISSGAPKVSQDAILAIVGAVALQHGGEAARRVMEERILPGARVAESLRASNQ